MASDILEQGKAALLNYGDATALPKEMETRQQQDEALLAFAKDLVKTFPTKDALAGRQAQITGRLEAVRQDLAEFRQTAEGPSQSVPVMTPAQGKAQQSEVSRSN